jgi:tripartite-type tricarboxylate transporter receptor subunit TctC
VALLRTFSGESRGHVQVYFGTVASSIGYVKSGNLRALAVTGATRSDALPDIPCVGEFVPGYEGSNWQGIGAPRNTPTEIIDKLNKEINGTLADPKMKARLADLGSTPFVNSPADFGKFIADFTEKWGQDNPGSQYKGRLRPDDKRSSITADTRMRGPRSMTG